MDNKQLFGLALGLQEPWLITGIDFKTSELTGDKELHIKVDFYKGSKFRGTDSKSYTAYAVQANRVVATNAIRDMFGHIQDHTCANAMRHALWSALNRQDLGAARAEEFGNAHEAIPGNPSNFLAMDLHNNNIGYIVGGLPTTTRFLDLIDALCLELAAGNLRVFANPNDNNSTVIDSSQCSCP